MLVNAAPITHCLMSINNEQRHTLDYAGKCEDETAAGTVCGEERHIWRALGRRGQRRKTPKIQKCSNLQLSINRSAVVPVRSAPFVPSKLDEPMENGHNK